MSRFFTDSVRLEASLRRVEHFRQPDRQTVRRFELLLRRQILAVELFELAGDDEQLVVLRRVQILEDRSAVRVAHHFAVRRAQLSSIPENYFKN